eukprot:COSAG04_NODE_111_length_25781_cov_90.291761_19_plen_74_part_00
MASAAAKHGGPFRWTDPDFLMTGGAGCDTFAPGTQCPGMTDIEYRTEFASGCEQGCGQGLRAKGCESVSSRLS